MESYRSEEEQLEALKRWWDENGRGTIMAVVLALGLGFGWQFWQKNREAAAADASFTFQQMLAALAEDTPQARARGGELAQQLKEAHRGSTYAQFAAMQLARLAVADGDLPAAEEELHWVLGKADGALKDVAQLRLGRVLAAQGQTEEALMVLAAGQGGELAASFAMARGEVLMAAGRDDEARLAFDAAAASLDPSQPLPQSLQEKIGYLNPQPPAAAVPEAG